MLTQPAGSSWAIVDQKRLLLAHHVSLFSFAYCVSHCPVQCTCLDRESFESTRARHSGLLLVRRRIMHSFRSSANQRSDEHGTGDQPRPVTHVRVKGLFCALGSRAPMMVATLSRGWPRRPNFAGELARGRPTPLVVIAVTFLSFVV